MKFSSCLYYCKLKYFDKNEPAISQLLSLYAKYYHPINKCGQFCHLYITFLENGKALFGNKWKQFWRRQMNSHTFVLYKCSVCNLVMGVEQTAEHILIHFKRMGFDPVALSDEEYVDY